MDCSSRKCFSISSNIHGNAQKHLVYCNTWRKLSNRGWGGFAWKSCLSHRLIVRVKAKTCCVRTDCAAHMIDCVFQEQWHWTERLQSFLSDNVRERNGAKVNIFSYTPAAACSFLTSSSDGSFSPVQPSLTQRGRGVEFVFFINSRWKVGSFSYLKESSHADLITPVQW